MWLSLRGEATEFVATGAVSHTLAPDVYTRKEHDKDTGGQWANFAEKASVTNKRHSPGHHFFAAGVGLSDALQLFDFLPHNGEKNYFARINNSAKQ